MHGLKLLLLWRQNSCKGYDDGEVFFYSYYSFKFKPIGVTIAFLEHDGIVCRKLLPINR